jgi:YD repeat-containing protein
VALPNGTGATTYLYQGNLVQATGPSGRWKKNYYDVFGNIAQVVEPNPAGGEVTTTYTYNARDQVTRVEMPRVGYTQVRTFTYSAGRLVSKTEPESGTTSYTYNWDGTLASKTDARNQTR